MPTRSFLFAISHPFLTYGKEELNSKVFNFWKLIKRQAKNRTRQQNSTRFSNLIFPWIYYLITFHCIPKKIYKTQQ
ncbi:hypothetical protein OIU78_006937 [Salix suchowensis]|nr:hypothetical protein OIU78_006937 [Salix suchowensis]